MFGEDLVAVVVQLDVQLPGRVQEDTHPAQNVAVDDLTVFVNLEGRNDLFDLLLSLEVLVHSHTPDSGPIPPRG